MRVIFMIPSKPPPKVAEPEKWSKEFNDFLALCLMKNPDQRPTAEALLESPFFAGNKDGGVLLPLIKEADEIISRIGRGEALGLESESGSEEEDEPRSSRPVASESGTMNMNTCQNFSTMIISEGSETMKYEGTMKVNSDDGFVPQFMSFLDKEKETPASTTKYSEMTNEELKRRLADVMEKGDRDVEKIRKKYEKQKMDIDAALKMRRK